MLIGDMCPPVSTHVTTELAQSNTDDGFFTRSHPVLPLTKYGIESIICDCPTGISEFFRNGSRQRIAVGSQIKISTACDESVFHSMGPGTRWVRKVFHDAREGNGERCLSCMDPLNRHTIS